MRTEPFFKKTLKLIRYLKKKKTKNKKQKQKLTRTVREKEKYKEPLVTHACHTGFTHAGGSFTHEATYLLLSQRWLQ